MLQGSYGDKNPVGIKEAFVNLAQATEEYREELINLTEANMSLETQVAEHANHMATKDSAMATMQKKIIQLQGKIKILKSNLSDQAIKKPDTYGYNKGKCWSDPYFWMRVVVRHDGE